MIINDQNLAGLYRGYSALFNKGLKNTASYYRDVSMVVPSTAALNDYGWLGAMPAIREWIGDRIINSLSVSSYTLANKLFEMTIEVERTKIEDDQYGLFGPIAEKIGADTARHPDDLVFSLLKAGFTEKCYDGQYFFDTDHPVKSGDGEVSVSNMQAGAGDPWFLVDASQPIKPMIYQDRMPFDFQALTDSGDPHVFLKDKYVYGVRGRSNAGFGLWQLAFGSKATLDQGNYTTARAAMMSLKGDNGKTLAITPTHLIVSPNNEAAGRKLLKEYDDQGATNEWAASVKLIVSHYLA